MSRRILSRLKALASPKGASGTPIAHTVWPEEPLNATTDEHGGFFPASLGTVLESRYAILRKLGYGQHSNVWLANDLRDQRQVALKILSAHATKAQGRVADELTYLKRIRDMNNSPEHPGVPHLPTLLNNFWISSVHGSHLCLVTVPLGDSLHILRQAKGGRLSADTVRTVARQLLLALDYLHYHCGIVHTDIKPNNILLAIKDLDTVLSNERSDDVPDKVQTVDVSCPINPILSKPIRLDFDHLGAIDVCLVDLGTAALTNGYHAEIIQPIALRAPEVILGLGWDEKADVWSLGCVIFELLTGATLFRGRHPDWSQEAYFLAHMGPLVGDTFNTEWAASSPHFDKYFKQGGLRLTLIDGASLDDLLRRYKIPSQHGLSSFLREMLRLKPSDRSNVKTLLEHEWLTATNHEAMVSN